VTVEIIVPWRAGCPHREQALTWVQERWASLQLPVVVAEAAAGPWVKASAVIPAASRSTAEILVVADADVWCDTVADAVEAVRGGAPWAIPHGSVLRLTEQATATVLLGANLPAVRSALVEPPYRGHAGGGLVVIPRSTLLDIAPDPRFEGWGGEDDAWGYALSVLAGRPWRGSSPLWHLWHPPQPRVSRRVGNATSQQLLNRYHRARRNPAAMRALVDEGRQTWRNASASS
jgi:hypothetical protein